MKTEKIDPDPFPPPYWKAPGTGVDELLTLGGVNTHRLKRPGFVRALLTRSGIALKQKNAVTWLHYAMLLRGWKNDGGEEKNESYTDC